MQVTLTIEYDLMRRTIRFDGPVQDRRVIRRMLAEALQALETDTDEKPPTIIIPQLRMRQ